MKQKELLVIAVSIFFTIIAWVSIELYKVRRSNLVEEQTVLPAVGSYEIDVSVLNKLREKSGQP